MSICYKCVIMYGYKCGMLNYYYLYPESARSGYAEV